MIFSKLWGNLLRGRPGKQKDVESRLEPHRTLFLSGALGIHQLQLKYRYSVISTELKQSRGLLSKQSSRLTFKILLEFAVLKLSFGCWISCGLEHPTLVQGTQTYIFHLLFDFWKLCKSESPIEREETSRSMILLPPGDCLPGTGRPRGFAPKDYACILPCELSPNKIVLGAWTGVYPFQPSVVTTRLKSYAYISVPSLQPNKSQISFLKNFRKSNV